MKRLGLVPLLKGEDPSAIAEIFAPLVRAILTQTSRTGDVA